MLLAAAVVFFGNNNAKAIGLQECQGVNFFYFSGSEIGLFALIDPHSEIDQERPNEFSASFGHLLDQGCKVGLSRLQNFFFTLFSFL